MTAMRSEDDALHQARSHHPREFKDFTYVYPVISRRSGGISIGVNLNLDKACNFDCPYCQIDRSVPKSKGAIDPESIRAEVSLLLDAVDKDGVCRLPQFAGVSDSAKRLRDIAISGDGEPTMVPQFAAVCDSLAGLQAERPELDFKLVLITNSTLLDRPNVIAGIDRLLSRRGEVWAKLDAGTEAWYQRVNVTKIPLDRIETNLIRLGATHPFSIQTMFHGFNGNPPPSSEVDAWLERLRRIRISGSRVMEVQLYTLARNPSHADCTPVPRAFLESARDRVARELRLSANVYGVAE